MKSLREQAMENDSYPYNGIVVGLDPEANFIQIFWIMEKGNDSCYKMFFEEGRLKVMNCLNFTSYSAMSGKVLNKIHNKERQNCLYSISNIEQDLDSLKEGLEESILEYEYKHDLNTRITAISKLYVDHLPTVEMEIFKKMSTNDEYEKHLFYPKLEQGLGYCITTTQSLSQEDELCIIPLIGMVNEDFASLIFDSLPKNRILLGIKSINFKEGIYSCQVINRFNPVN